MQVPACAHVRIETDQVLGTRDRRIYGHFLEQAFFGNVDGGVFDEGSPLSRSGGGLADGLRADVIALCRRLDVPVVRWPGGNFTSSYAWTDGVGPRDQRPRRLNLDWGVEESNRFGTDEFLTWCEEVGAEPFLVHGAKDVQDAARWVEYTNYGGDTALTRQRATNGRAGPVPVRLWGVGNEVYGEWQQGHRGPGQYAADAREHAFFMRAVDPAIQLVGVGLPEERWILPLLQQTAGALDYLSLHLYGASTHLFTGRDVAEFDAVVAQATFFEHRIAAFADLVEDVADRVGLDRPPAIAMDEWNVRHLEPVEWPAPERGEAGGVAARRLPSSWGSERRVNRYSPRTLADALCYAGVFHALHRLCGRAAAPSMANTVNLVNANGLIEVRPSGVLPTATFHVWELYGRLGETVHPVSVAGPVAVRGVRQGDERRGDGFAEVLQQVPQLDVIATSGRAGRQVALINRHATEALEVVITAGPAPLRTAAGRRLGEDADLFGVNTFAVPETVAVVDLGRVDLSDGLRLPAHSITLLEFA